jgi:hypothetical protein
MLTAAEQLSCFEILDISNAASGAIHNGYAIELTISDLDRLRDAVTTKLTGLNSDQETKVRAIVVEWDAIGFQTGKISEGAMGTLNGLSDSFEDRRALLLKRLHIYVPMQHIIQGIARRHGSKPSSNISVIRG